MKAYILASRLNPSGFPREERHFVPKHMIKHDQSSGSLSHSYDYCHASDTLRSLSALYWRKKKPKSFVQCFKIGSVFLLPALSFSLGFGVIP